MSIKAADVAALRKRTGAGMMECKKALQEADGDIETAIENMRKAGMAKAAKKADRATAEGVVLLKQQDNNAILLEVNCETDFVARGDDFGAFVAEVAEVAISKLPANLDALLQCTLADGQTVSEQAKNMVATIGENIQVRRLTTLTAADNEQIGAYCHGGRIGALVHLEGGDSSVAHDVAMHVTASAPLVINPDDVSAELIEKERAIYLAQAENSGKPPEIQEKMTRGRIEKFKGEVSLTGQPFVRDPNTKVGALLKAQNAAVKQFVRYELGEGIEKKQENFAEEVMAQVKGS